MQQDSFAMTLQRERERFHAAEHAQLSPHGDDEASATHTHSELVRLHT